MLPEESYSNFALCLEIIAEKAFSAKKKERQLCQKMWKVSPTGFVHAMEECQRNLAFLSGERQMTWSMIRRLAVKCANFY